MIKKRILSLDILRTIAILSVLFMHAAQSFIISANSPPSVSFSSIASAIFITIGRIGVPLFFMLSGYLLLDRDYSDKASRKKFYKSNFIPLLICWEIWLLILYVCSVLFATDNNFSLSTIIRQALFLQNSTLSMSWYMPTILGIYLFLPYVSIALKKMNSKHLLVLLVVVYLYIFLVPSLNLFVEINNNPINNILDLSFGGGCYGFYVLLGYCIKRHEQIFAKILKTFKARLIHTLLLVLYFTITPLIIIAINSIANTSYSLWYNFFTLPIIALLLFVLCLRIDSKNKITEQTFLTISKYSFGIYLVHEPIQIVINKAIADHIAVSEFANILLVFGLSAIASLVLVWLICRSKKLGSLLFRVR